MNVSKGIFYFTLTLIFFTNVGFLFYYAHLVPLHIDEAGFWFNWTNKSLLHRIYNDNVSVGITPPWHGLTLYLAKISIHFFGHTGIGLRFPVILFGILSSGLLYVFSKEITGKKEVAFFAAVLLSLNPFFSHYSHELRGYSSLFFFSLYAFYYLFRLTQERSSGFYWVLLFLSFLGCYLSNMASPIFFFVFLVTLFILKFYRNHSYPENSFSSLKNLAFSRLFLFSLIASIVFSYLLFYFDASYLRVMKKYLGNRVPNLLAIPDFFSTFLGYKYLDDPASILHHHPLYLWGVSLVCCLVGTVISFRKREIFSMFFVVSLVVTSLFYVLSGSHIHTRSAIFLMPFFLLYQASGATILIQLALKQFASVDTSNCLRYWVLSGLTIVYFSAFHWGKYQNFDHPSDNPYEKARKYLKNNGGPNDLIIGVGGPGMRETIGGFYFGEMIRKKNRAVFY